MTPTQEGLSEEDLQALLNYVPYLEQQLQQALEREARLRHDLDNVGDLQERVQEAERRVQAKQQRIGVLEKERERLTVHLEQAIVHPYNLLELANEAINNQQYAVASDLLGGYQQAIELIPSLSRNHEAHYTLGVVYAKMHEKTRSKLHFKQAETALKRSIDLGADYKANYLLGLVLLKEKKNDEAKGQFERVLELQGYHGNTHFQLAKIHGAEGEYTDALEHLGHIKEPADYVGRLMTQFKKQVEASEA